MISVLGCVVTIHKLGGGYQRLGGTWCRRTHDILNKAVWTRIWEASDWRYVDQFDNFGFKDITEDQVFWDVRPCLWEFSDISKERGVFVFRVKQS